MGRRNPYLVLGLLSLLVGIIFLLAPADPQADPGRFGFTSFWWISAPAVLIGIVLMAIGRRRARMGSKSRT